MQHDRETSALPEEVEMILNMMAHLEKQVEADVSKFTASSHTRYFPKQNANPSDGDRDDRHHDRPSHKELILTWNPDRTADSPFEHIRQFEIHFSPAVGWMTFQCQVYDNGKSNNSISVKHPGQFSHDQYDMQTSFMETYDIGMANTDTIIDMKKRFLRMFKAVNAYWNVEIPKRNKERTSNFFCHLFPQIVEDILMKELTDEEGNN